MFADNGPALTGPAYRIETARTRLRCFQPSDAALLSRAIAESLEHLKPWMPWAVHEPMAYEARVTWLRTQRGNFDLGAELAMGIFSKDESEVLGCAGLIRGDVDAKPGARHEIVRDAAGRRVRQDRRRQPETGLIAQARP